MYAFHAHAVQNESNRRIDSVRPNSHRAHVRPVRACSCSARARLAPLLRPVQSRSPRPAYATFPVPSVSDVFPASAVRARSIPLFPPPGFPLLIGLRPPPELSVFPIPTRFLNSARPRPHRSPELSPAVPPHVRPPRQKRTTLSLHNTMTTKNHNAAPRLIGSEKESRELLR